MAPKRWGLSSAKKEAEQANKHGPQQGLKRRTKAVRNAANRTDATVQADVAGSPTAAEVVQAEAFLNHKVSYGSMTGWVRPSDDPAARVSFELSIDDLPIGQYTANALARGLRRKGLGDGMYGFRIPIPDKFLDGEVHQYKVAPIQTDRSFEPKVRSARFPKWIPEIKPWVNGGSEPTTADAELSESHRDLLRLVDAAPTMEEAVRAARRALEETPGLADRPLGIVERLQREAGDVRLMSDRIGKTGWSQRARRRACLTTEKSSMQTLAENLDLPVPAVVWSGSSVEDLVETELPRRFVLKRDGLSGTTGVVLVHDGYDLIHRQPASLGDLVRWSQQIEAKRKARGKDEDAVYLIEEFLVQEGASEGDPVIPLDYKMYCFGGKVRFVQVIDRNGLGGGKGRETWYTRDWRRTPEPLNHYYDPGDAIARPQCLVGLLEIGDEMSAVIGSFVRIDGFCSARGAVFGELSFSPFGGREFTPHGDERLGELWHIYYGP